MKLKRFEEFVNGPLNESIGDADLQKFLEDLADEILPRVRDRAILYAETKAEVKPGSKSGPARYSMMLSSIVSQMLSELGNILNKRRIG